jgi:hypothetical protein
MKKNYIAILIICLSTSYVASSQNKRPAPLGKPSYATLGVGRFFDQSVFLRLGYEQRVRKHFGVEFYLAPSLPLGISSQFRILNHFGTVSNSNYTNFDPYLGGSIGAKFMKEFESSGQVGVFSGFRIMPKPEYGFYVETGINYTGRKFSDTEYEVQIQVGICRKFLSKKPI